MKEVAIFGSPISWLDWTAEKGTKNECERISSNEKLTKVNIV